MSKTGEFDLSSGRRIYLRGLRQYLTYEGLLEGLPTAERNKEVLERLIDDNRYKPDGGGSYLIHPTETPIDFSAAGRPYPFGTPSALPAVTCIGRFASLEPARNASSDMSRLVVIWFQEEFAFPIDPDVVARLKALDWETLGVDMDY